MYSRVEVYIIYFIIMIVDRIHRKNTYEEYIEGYYFDSITQSRFLIIHKVCNVGIFVILIFKNRSKCIFALNLIQS